MENRFSTWPPCLCFLFVFFKRFCFLPRTPSCTFKSRKLAGGTTGLSKCNLATCFSPECLWSRANNCFYFLFFLIQNYPSKKIAASWPSYPHVQDKPDESACALVKSARPTRRLFCCWLPSFWLVYILAWYKNFDQGFWQDDKMEFSTSLHLPVNWTESYATVLLFPYRIF